jgi:hypothetical protein
MGRVPVVLVEDKGIQYVVIVKVVLEEIGSHAVAPINLQATPRMSIAHVRVDNPHKVGDNPPGLEEALHSVGGP